MRGLQIHICMQEIEISRYVFELPEDRVVNPAHLTVFFGPVLVCSQKAVVGWELKYISYFKIHSSIMHEKCCKLFCKYFLLCFTTTETYRGIPCTKVSDQF